MQVLIYLYDLIHSVIYLSLFDVNERSNITDTTLS
jgi:hypothetical protein